jgi:hypothetical protein
MPKNATMPAKDDTGRRPPKQAKVQNLTPRGSGGRTTRVKLATRDPRRARG